MSSWKHTLGGVATFGLVALLHSDLSVAASLAVPRVMGPTARRTDLSASSSMAIRDAASLTIVIPETTGGSIAPTRLRMTAMPAACRTSITRRKPIGAVGQ